MDYTRCLQRTVVPFGCTLAFPMAVLARRATGSISGNVRDPSQAAVVNTLITLRNTAADESASVTSNSLGYYLIASSFFENP